MFEDLMSDYGSRLFIAVAGVGLGLVCLFVVLMMMRRRTGPSPFLRGGKNRQPRLQVLDAAAVDARRRIVLIRRDDVEHLVMIGGPTDVVIESGIGAARAKPSPLASEEAEVPALAEPAAEPRLQAPARQPQLSAPTTPAMLPTEPSAPPSARERVPVSPAPVTQAPGVSRERQPCRQRNRLCLFRTGSPPRRRTLRLFPLHRSRPLALPNRVSLNRVRGTPVRRNLPPHQNRKKSLQPISNRPHPPVRSCRRARPTSAPPATLWMRRGVGFSSRRSIGRRHRSQLSLHPSPLPPRWICRRPPQSSRARRIRPLRADLAANSTAFWKKRWPTTWPMFSLCLA